MSVSAPHFRPRLGKRPPSRNEISRPRACDPRPQPLAHTVPVVVLSLCRERGEGTEIVAAMKAQVVLVEVKIGTRFGMAVVAPKSPFLASEITPRLPFGPISSLLRRNNP